MRTSLITIFFLIPTFFSFSQKGFEMDTIYLNIEKQKSDTNKFYALFYKSLNLSVNDLKFSGFLAQKSYELAKKLKFQKGISMACDILGNFSMQTGDYTTSYKWMKLAIKQKERLKDDFGSAVSCNQLTKLLRLMGNYKLALPNSFKTLSITNKLGIPKFNALAFNSIANVYYDLKQLDSSAKYYEKAIVFYNNSKDSSAYALALTNLGTIAKDQNQIEKCISYNKRALDFLTGLGDTRLELLVYSNLGSAYLKTFNLKDCGEMFEKAKLILNVYAEADQKLDFYDDYSEYLFRSGKFKEAYEASEKYQELKDSLKNVEVNKNIGELETKYQTKRKEQENKLLKQKREIDKLSIAEGKQKSFLLTVLLFSILVVLIVLVLFFVNRVRTSKKLKIKNEQINKQNNTLKILNSQLIESEEELLNANEAKGQLLSIISHDISSPIKALYNFEDGIISKMEFLQTQELKEAFIKLYKSTSDIYIMSNNLLDYAHTHQEGFVPTNGEVKLKSLIDDILNLLEQASKNKHLRIDNKIESAIIIQSDINLLYIMIRNIISNAIKFSPDSKIIKIEWNAQQKAISVIDQGNGIEKPKIDLILQGNNFHSSLGTQGEKGTGLGMKIVYSCAQKLGATIDIKSEMGKGTNFTIKL